MSFLSYGEMFRPQVMIRVNGQPMPELERRRLDFRFIDKFRKRDECVITFSDHDRALTDGAFLQPDDVWEVRFGWHNDLSRIRVLTLKTWHPDYSEEFPRVQCNFVVSRGRKRKGKKVTYGTEPHRVSGSRNWGVVDSSVIAKRIARRHKLTPKIEKSVDASRDTPFIQPSNVSDYEYLAMLADDIDFEFFIEDSKLYYRAKPYEERPRRAFFFYPKDNNTLLLSFSPEVKIAPAGKASKGADTKGDKHVVKNAADLIALNKQLAKEGNVFAQGMQALIDRGYPVEVENETTIVIKREQGKSQEGCKKTPTLKGDVPSGNPPTGIADPKVVAAFRSGLSAISDTGVAGRIFVRVMLNGGRTEIAGPGKGRFKVSGIGEPGKLIEFEPEGTLITAETDKEKRDCVTKASYRKMVDKAVTARASFIGSPTIRARANYSVLNVGRRFSGKWYAKDATHHITASDDYKVSLVFKRGTLKDSRGQKAKSKDDKKKDNERQKPPQPGLRVKLQGGRRIDFVDDISVPQT